MMQKYNGARLVRPAVTAAGGGGGGGGGGRTDNICPNDTET